MRFKGRRRWVLLLGIVIVLVIALVLVRGNVRQRPREILMNVPPLNQGDYPEAICVVGGQKKSVKSSGCGAVCVSIVGQYITGNDSLGPEMLFEWAYDNGYYFGDGLGHECLTAMAELFGLKAEWVSNRSERILESIRDRRPVIAHMGHGHFSGSSGHYILLIGENEDGQIIVHDPGKRANCGKAYDMDFLLREAKMSGAFMVTS